MEISHKKPIINYSFCLSLLMHLLILLSMLLVIKYQPTEHPKKKSHVYVPSYVYSGAVSPPPIAHHAQKSMPNKSMSQPSSEQQSAQVDAKPMTTVAPSRLVAAKHHAETKHTSMLAASTAALQQEQFKALSNRKDDDPILMIGDTSQAADPLLKLMGRSLSAHFRYPDAEGMMGIKGRVVLGITLHPEGYYTDVEMLKSSENQNLDAAALYAVNTAPRAIGASAFIKEPKRFIIGFIFE